MGARRQFEEMPNKKVKSGLKKVLHSMYYSRYIWLIVTLVFDFERAEPISSTLQICAWQIPRKVVFFEKKLYWFKCTIYSLYDIKRYF